MRALFPAVIVLTAFSFSAAQAQISAVQTQACRDPPGTRRAGSVSNKQGHDATRQLTDGLGATIPPSPHVLPLPELRAAILIASRAVKKWDTQRLRLADIAAVGGCGKPVNQT
jgi:hypothetical protein